MERISIADLERNPYDEELHSDRREIGTALGAEHVAIVRYALEPGERLSGSVHAHADQEEVFVVLEGTVTFDVERLEGADGGTAEPVGSDERREITVAETEAIRFAPGEFQSGRNATDDRAVVLALGAPRETDDIRISRIPVLDEDVSCPDCGRDSMRMPSDHEAAGLECPDCGARLRPE